MKKNQEESESTSNVVVIESFDQLQKIIDEPLYCDFKIDGRNIRLPCKRLSQVVDEQVRTIRRKAQPKYRQDMKDYDYMEPTYLKLREENEKVARNLIVYTCCPAISAKRPGLTTPEQINTFVKDLLSEQILELIALTIQAGGMELVDRANFTSTPDSAKS